MSTSVTMQVLRRSRAVRASALSNAVGPVRFNKRALSIGAQPIVARGRPLQLQLQRRLALGALGREIQHLKEHLAKKRSLERRRERKTEDELFGRPYKPKPQHPPRINLEDEETVDEAKVEGSEAAEGEQTEGAEAAEGEAEPLVSEEEKAKTPLDRDRSVVLIDRETVWDKRLEKFREMFRFRSILRKTGLHEKAAESETVAKLTEKLTEVKDKIADVRDIYDTSQHPMVEQLRNVQDKMLGESATGYAMGELLKMDPDFNLHDFLRELEEYLIPMIVKGYLKGDKTLLYNCVEDEAERWVNQSLKMRENQKEIWDERILDIMHVDVGEAKMINDVPNVRVTFIAQQVNCVRNAKTGEIVRGHESAVVNVMYSWWMRKDFEGEDFDWKLTEFQHFTIQELAV